MTAYLSYDSILVFSEAIIAAYLISWFQKSPSGDIGIIDFILGQHEPRLRLKSISFGFLVPIILGLIIGFMKPSSIFIGGVGTFLGSFFAVSTAFFHPNLLAPPLQEKLWKARFIYFLFMISYGMLGTFGTYITLELPNQLQNDSFQINLLSSFVWGIFIPFVSIGAILLVNNKFKYTFKEQNSLNNENKNIVNENIFEVISTEVNDAVRVATAAAIEEVKSHNSTFEKSLRDEIEKQLDEITRMAALAYKQEKIREGRNYGYHNVSNVIPTLPYYESWVPYPSMEQQASYYFYGGYYLNGRYIRHKYPTYFS